MASQKLTLTLHEPTFCGQIPAVSNELVSLQYIPSTALRGAFAAALSAEGRAHELDAWFSASGPHWSPALPIHQSGQKVIPTPLCFLQEKKDKPLHGRYFTWNVLHGTPPLTGEEIRFQWTRLNSKWLRLNAVETVEDLHDVRTRSSMHVGLHYGRQAHRDQALFSREEICPGQQFVAYLTNNRMAEQLPTQLFLGKRRSAGNGNITVEISEVSSPWPINPVNHVANVQLMSDAIVPDPACGAFSRGLSASDWSRILGVRVEVPQAASTSRIILGWSGTTGLSRDRVIAISAGSVFKLTSADPALESAVHRLAAKGLGTRRHEGFGIIAVNPPWLDCQCIEPTHSTPQPTSARPAPWPGFTTDDYERLIKLATLASEITGFDAQKAAALAHYSARVNRVADVTTHLHNLGHRTNAHGWEKLHGKLNQPLGAITDIAQARFFLNLLANCAKESR